MHGLSSFIDVAAVEAWDAWFRWRECGRLQDVSVEATWRRTARALATTEPASAAAGYETTLVTAFAAWRLLLDERVLASAGTGTAAWPNNDLVAVLNAATFVRERFSPNARFDLVAFSKTAQLAVKALDSAALLGSGPPPRTFRQRIGIIGLADALALLDTRYDSAAGCAQIDRIGRALAEGCFRGAVESAQKHGVCIESTNEMLELAARRGMPSELVEDGLRHGIRHASLTAITSQPRLALFANNVADALDPLAGEDIPYHIATPERTRVVHSSGYALTLRHTHRGRAATLRASAEIAARPKADARIAMRDVLQPWIDEPIVHALAEAHPNGREPISANDDSWSGRTGNT